MSVILALLVLWTFPLLGTAARVHEGKVVSLMSVGYMANVFEKHREEFENITGAQVRIKRLPSLDHVNYEMGAQAETGVGDDIYLFTSTVMPEFVDRGLLEDLTDRVRTDEGLVWEDVVPFFRKNNVGYNNRVYALPVDGDLLVLLWRKDKMEKAPETLEELVEKAKELNGKDHNGDGIPDRAWCECMGPSNDSTVYYILGDHLMQFVAPYLQTKGSEQGAFFDPTTLKPLVHNPGFKKGMKLLYDMFTLGSNSSDWQCEGGSRPYTRARDLFLSGNCIFSSFWSSAYMLEANKTNAYVLDKMSHAPFPGSKEVVVDGELTPCSEKACPLGVETSGTRINFAPFAAYGGFVGAVNRHSAAKDAAYDFLSFCNQPRFMEVDVVVEAALEPVRWSQLKPEVWNKGIPGQPDLTKSFLDTTAAILSNKNILVDLRIPGSITFIQEAGKMVSAVVRGELSLENAGADLEARWEKVINANGGRERLLPLYRASLNLPPLQDTSSGWSPEPWQIALIVVGVILLLGVAAAATVKASQNRRMYELQFDNNVVAERCAMAIADMDLEQVDYLKEIENPNKIQRAFMQIVERLKQYKAYMPQSLFAMDETDGSEAPAPANPAPSASTSASSGGRTSRGLSAQLRMHPMKKQASLVMVTTSLHTRTYDAVECQTALLNTASQLTSGVMVYSNGDSMMLALNAASICPTHASRACNVAKAFESAVLELGEDRLGGPVGIAAVSGMVLIANCGSESIRSFTIFGRALLRLQVAAKIAEEFPFVTPVCDSQLCSSAIGHMQFRSIALLPPNRRGSSEHSGLLYHIAVPLNHTASEWMYQLGDTEDDLLKNPLILLSKGDPQGIEEMRKALKDSTDPVLQHALSRALSHGPVAGVGPAPVSPTET